LLEKEEKEESIKEKIQLSIGVYGINNLINYVTFSERDINAEGA
jgi:hypothetical protein